MYDPNTGAYIPDAGTPAVGAQPTTQISTPQASAQIGQQFQFDPNKYLPSITQQAAGIYSPQVAQIQALQKLGQTQAEQTKVTTKEQFAKQMQAEIEAINARGAFFGGGAIQRQSDIGTEQTRALNAIDLQQQAANAQAQGQLGQLGAQQTQYIQEQLQGQQSSAYRQFQDQQQALIQERAFQAQQAESERNYQQSVKESERNYQLQLKSIKAQEKANKISSKDAKKKSKRAKEEFDKELAYKYASLKKSSGGSKSEKGSAYIDAQGNVVELPSGYNYVGGLGQLNKDANEPIF